MLNPALKDQYWEEFLWSDNWSEVGIDLTTEEFTTNYEGKFQVKVAVEPADIVPVTSARFSCFKRGAGAPSSSLKSNTVTKIQQYLRDPLVDTEDPIKWWYEVRHKYPSLSQMGRDFLVIPPSSTGVEHLFSQGHHVISFSRNQLNEDTICALMCMGDWSQKNVIVPDDLVLTLREAAPKGSKYSSTSSKGKGKATNNGECGGK